MLWIHTLREVEGALNIISTYEGASGMLLNRAKSVVLAHQESRVTVGTGFRREVGDRYLGV